MFNRTLQRPMFRLGGSAGTGITSGLSKPRQGYNKAGKVYEWDELDPEKNKQKLIQLKILGTIILGTIIQVVVLRIQIK